jgi:adenosylhomocysteinase
MVCGYGDVGKVAHINAWFRCRVELVKLILFVRYMQNDGYEVILLKLAGNADIFITATGNCDVIRVDHILILKNNAIV